MADLSNFGSTGIQVVTPDPTGEGGKAINDNFKVLARYVLPESIKIAAFTIPAIAANTRQVVTVTLGTLLNSQRAIVGFYSGSTTDTDIESIIPINIVGQLKGMQQLAATEGSNVGGLTPVISSGASMRMMVVTRNYQEAIRCLIPLGESRGTIPGVGMPYGYRYSVMNVGVLFGYYGYGSGGAGVLKLDKRVEMESAWLTQPGSDMVLNMAFYNRDTAANTSLSLKCAVFE